jgi:site-specific recombinase XerD
MVENQTLFPITRRQFGRIFERHCLSALIPRHLAHPHILKHTLAMQTIHSAGIENVRQYLGHKSISSTGAYLKVSDAAASSKIQSALRGPSVD